METPAPGRLYVVATPIGNLGDLSPRALDILRRVDRIAAEDTRHTRRLLAHFGVRARLLALHEHNEEARVAQLLAWLLAGEDLALVSDAGTPLISDPGYRLVRALRAAGIVVSPVPGPNAAIAALSAAGVASDRFAFEGFLPTRGAARRSRLQALAHEPRTLVLYESSHRILALLEDLAESLGAERHVVVARELTKQFETLLDGPVGQVLARVRSDPDQQRGEFVVIVEAAPVADADAALALGRRAFEVLQAELPPSSAARLAAEISGVSRRLLYRPGAVAPDEE